jgi:mono/diheme cytochrome c family protein
MKRLGLLILVLLLAAGCTRQRPSEKPPLHVNPDMDDQPKYEAQEPSKFFADGKAMRDLVPGTVARGYLRNDKAYYTGVSESGDTVETMPVTVDLDLLERGQERFNIYCSPCHSKIGDGKGIMVERGYVPPPSFHDDRLRNFPDGHIFIVISHGIRNMPSYGSQIPVDDRWAIVAYVRALERAQNASLEDVPVERRKELQQQQ